MLYSRAKGELSPSPRRIGAGLPPPTPPSIGLERDAKTLLKNLRMMDEIFHINDDSTERRLRLQLLEERQTALQRLCEMALQKKENEEQVEMSNEQKKELVDHCRVETGIVSTPQSIESFSTYNDTGARHNAAISLLPPPPSPLPPSGREMAVSCRKHCGGEPAHMNSSEKASVTASAVLKLGPFRPLPSPLPFEKDELEEDRRLIEDFFSVSQEACAHPYAMQGACGPQLVKEAKPPLSRANLRHFGEGNAAAKRTNSEENFDMMEEEQLLKCILLQKPQRIEEASREKSIDSGSSCCVALTDETAHTARQTTSFPKREDGAPGSVTINTLFVDPCRQQRRSQLARPFPSHCRGVGSTGEGEVKSWEKTPFNTGGDETLELMRKNRFLCRELEARGVALRELTLKTESLARHLVRFMRERAQLRGRTEQLEELLAAASAEVERLQRDAMERGERGSDSARWRAAVYTKERELRICKDELFRLRDLADQRVFQNGNLPAQGAHTMTLQQLNSDVEDLFHELGVARFLQRRAEARAERISDEFETAQLQIQLLDKRLVEAERAAATRQVQEVQEGLPLESDFPPSLAFPSPQLIEDVTTWPAGARRELARLASYAEGLLNERAERDRHAELRLSLVCQENDELRVRCHTYESEVKNLEEGMELLRRERTLWNSSKQHLHHQLLNLQDNATSILDLLQATGKNAERVSKTLAMLDETDRVKREVEPFIKKVLRDWDTVIRFLTALQRTDLSDGRQEELRNLSLSTTTRTLRDVMFQAVEGALGEETISPSLSPPSLPPQQEEKQQPREIVALPTSHFDSLVTPYMTTAQDIMKDDIEMKNKTTKEKGDTNWEGSHMSETASQPLFQLGLSRLRKELVVTRDDLRQNNSKHEKGQPKNNVRALDPPVATPRTFSSTSRQPESFIEQRSGFPPPEISKRRRNNLVDTNNGNHNSSFAKGSAETSCNTTHSFISAADSYPEEKTTEFEQIYKGTPSIVPIASSPCATPIIMSDRKNVDDMVDSPAHEDEARLRVVVPNIPVLTLAADSVDMASVKQTPKNAPEQYQQPGVSNSASEQVYTTSVTTVGISADGSAVPQPEKNQTDVVIQPTLHVDSGVSKETRVATNKVRRYQSKDVDYSSSEPRLKMRGACEVEPKREELQLEKQTTLPLVDLTQEMQPCQTTNNFEKCQTIFTTDRKPEVASALDELCAKGEITCQLPILSRPTAGRRSDGCAPSLNEPQRSSMTRPVPSSLSVDELREAAPPLVAAVAEVPAERKLLNDEKSAVAEAFDTGRRRRVSAAMDFPSVRHPRFGPGRRQQRGGGSEELFESSDTKPEAS